MTLYEATNGMEGCAYMRCYAWARTDEEAHILTRQAFRDAGQRCENIRLRKLLTHTDQSFVTRVNDTGLDD